MRLSFKPQTLIVFFAGIALGSLITYLLIPAPTETKLTENRLKGSNYQFINPLLECDVSSPLTFHPDLTKLRNRILAYVDDQKSQKKLTLASVYYRDLNNGPTFGINETEKFAPASLIKVPLLMSYYKIAESDPAILNLTLLNKDNYDYSQQNVIPQMTIVPNTSYSISDLIDKMIVYSDNGAYYLLMEHLGSSRLSNTFMDLGLEHIVQDIKTNENALQVKEYASFFRILYNSSYLSKSYSEKALKLLSQTQFENGLKGQLPKNITVSHKFGERQYMDTGEKQLHDCGIVYYPQKPYLVCVMTRGYNFDDLAKSISHISGDIFETVKSEPAK
jgi:beta-lactamase class A